MIKSFRVNSHFLKFSEMVKKQRSKRVKNLQNSVLFSFSVQKFKEFEQPKIDFYLININMYLFKLFTYVNDIQVKF